MSQQRTIVFTSHLQSSSTNTKIKANSRVPRAPSLISSSQPITNTSKFSHPLSPISPARRRKRKEICASRINNNTSSYGGSNLAGKHTRERKFIYESERGFFFFQLSSSFNSRVYSAAAAGLFVMPDGG
jgi:hypothetical protein